MLTFESNTFHLIKPQNKKQREAGKRRIEAGVKNYAVTFYCPEIARKKLLLVCTLSQTEAGRKSWRERKREKNFETTQPANII